MAIRNGRGKKLGALLTPELIEAIAQTFPREPLNLQAQPNEIWFREGQCSVAEILQAKFDEVNTNVLAEGVL
jgi:hypothetical protein